VGLVVAGPKQDKCEAEAEGLRTDFCRPQVSACYADAAIPDTVARALEGVDLLIVAAPVEQQVDRLARLCVDYGCDYLDICGAAETASKLSLLEIDAWRARRLLVTQAGLCPGLISTLVRATCAKLPGCRAVNVGIAISLKGFTRAEQVYGFVDAAAHNKPFLFQGGQWRDASFRHRRKIDYGGGFGIRTGLPLDLPELHGLREEAVLKELAVFGATPNWRLDCMLRSVLRRLYTIKTGLGREVTARFLLRASAQSNVPSGAVIAVQAWGDRDGRVDLRIRHNNVFQFTAAVLVSFVRQYLAGEFQTVAGVRFMGHILDGSRALRELVDFGVQLDDRAPGQPGCFATTT
jgi:hypothetical protein